MFAVLEHEHQGGGRPRRTTERTARREPLVANVASPPVRISRRGSWRARGTACRAPSMRAGTQVHAHEGRGCREHAAERVRQEARHHPVDRESRGVEMLFDREVRQRHAVVGVVEVRTSAVAEVRSEHGDPARRASSRVGAAGAMRRSRRRRRDARGSSTRSTPSKCASGSRHRPDVADHLVDVGAVAEEVDGVDRPLLAAPDRGDELARGRRRRRALARAAEPLVDRGWRSPATPRHATSWLTRRKRNS